LESKDWSIESAGFFVLGWPRPARVPLRPWNAGEHDLNNASGPNLGAVADADIAQDFRPGADENAVSNFRMTVAVLFSGSAKGNPMQQRHIVANVGGFPNDNPRRMVDEYSTAYFAAG